MKFEMRSVEMYFVNQEHIEEILDYMDQLLDEMDNLSDDSLIHQLAFERLTHLIIESIIDVGNMMIDGFIMRDPGSYDDIIDILVDEKVLPESEMNHYKEVIALREMLVQRYLQVNGVRLRKTMLDNEMILNQFSDHIRSYLRNESDVAHAFSNQN